jgi:hypothetical protein
MRRLVAVLVTTALVLAACGGDDDDDAAADPTPMEESDRTPAPAADPGPAGIEGLQTFGDLSAGHERGDLDYPTNPPVGGDHSPFWQACGVYAVEIYEERAVHALEHGAVWIAHTPGLDVSALEPLVSTDQHLLMSPVEGLDAPIVLSAWGAQVAVDGVDDPRIEAFVAEFVRQGPENAPCVGGGVGVPPADIGPDLDV